MKRSNLFARNSIALLLAGFMIVSPLGVEAQTVLAPTYADFSQASQQINGLSKILTSLGNNQVIANNPALSSQLSGTLNEINQIRQGIDAVNQLVNIPALGNIASQPGGIPVALEGLREISTLPILQNFPGIKELSGQLGELGDLASFGTAVSGAIKDPNIKTLAAVAAYFDPNTVIGSGIGGDLGSIVSGFASSITGSGGTGSFPNPLSATSALGQALTGITSLLKGNTEISKVTRLSGSTAVIEGAKTLTKIAGPEQLGVDFASAIGAGTSCGASVDGAVRDLGGAYLSKLVGGAVSAATGGIIKGTTPTVEQSGPLLTLISQNKNLTSIICKNLDEMRAIQRELLKIQMDFYNKENYDDPAARDKTVEIIRQKQTLHKDKLKKRTVPGETTESGEVVTTTYYPTQSEFVEEKSRNAAKVGLAAVEESSIPDEYKEDIVRTLEQQQKLTYGTNKVAQIAEVLTPVPSENPDDLWSNFLAASHPQNTYYGSYFLAKNTIDAVTAEAAQEARDTYVAGGGVAPREKCAPGATIKNKKGEVLCTKYVVEEPGSIFGQYTSAINTADIVYATNQDERGDEKRADRIFTQDEEDYYEEETGTKGITIGDIFSIFGTVCELKPTLGICGNKVKKPQPIFTEPISTAPLDTSIPGTTEDVVEFPTVGAGISNSTQTPGVPALDTRIVNNYSPRSINSSTITWSAANLSSCVAGNDWYTWGNGIDRAIATTTVATKGEDVGTFGTLRVFHPTLFELSARAIANLFDDKNGQIPVDQDDITTTFNGAAQITTYKPNLAGAETIDEFEIDLNGQILRTTNDLAALTPEQLVTEFKNLKTNLSTSDSRFPEYNKVTFDGTNALVVTGTAPTPIPNTATYKIDCTGAGGAVSKTVTVTF